MENKVKVNKYEINDTLSFLVSTREGEVVWKVGEGNRNINTLRESYTSLGPREEHLRLTNLGSGRALRRATIIPLADHFDIDDHFRYRRLRRVRLRT